MVVVPGHVKPELLALRNEHKLSDQNRNEERQSKAYSDQDPVPASLLWTKGFQKGQLDHLVGGAGRFFRMVVVDLFVFRVFEFGEGGHHVGNTRPLVVSVFERESYGGEDFCIMYLL